MTALLILAGLAAFFALFGLVPYLITRRVLWDQHRNHQARYRPEYSITLRSTLIVSEDEPGAAVASSGGSPEEVTGQRAPHSVYFLADGPGSPALEAPPAPSTTVRPWFPTRVGGPLE